MRAVELGPSGELPMGPRSAVLGGVKMPTLVCGTHAGGPTGGFGGAPYGATKRMRGVPNWVSRTHADGPTGGF
eukprot:1266292-Pyramimonas_sp.AAC.1